MDSTNNLKSTGGMRRLAKAFLYSRQGLLAAIRHEAAFRQELIFIAILIPIALFLPFSPLEQVLLIGTLLIVLITELINSAIEALTDLVSVEPHPLAGRAKDMGSAAVMLSIFLAVLTWLGVAAPVLIGRFG